MRIAENLLAGRRLASLCGLFASRAHVAGLFIALGLLGGTRQLPAQEGDVPRLSRDEIASHLMLWIPPVYPARAKADHVVGSVVVRVEIAQDGLVRSTKVVSGPALLRRPATDAIKQWRYQPFHQGNETFAVSGNVELTFTLHGTAEVHTPHEPANNGSYSVNLTFPARDNSSQPDAEIADRFDAVWEVCTRGVIAHSADQATTGACDKAAAIADEFAPNRRFVERRRAYVYAAIAMTNVHDLTDALKYAEKAVAVVTLGHDDNGGCEAAYAIRGEIRAFSGDAQGGDEDLSRAEEYGRKDQNSKSLKQDLQFHADLLNRMGRVQDASAKMEEAAKL